MAILKKNKGKRTKGGTKTHYLGYRVQSSVPCVWNLVPKSWHKENQKLSWVKAKINIHHPGFSNGWWESSCWAEAIPSPTCPFHGEDSETICQSGQHGLGSHGSRLGRGQPGQLW